MNNTMTFLDVFAGIGGFRLGMESVGFKCVGHIENDKFAQQSYNAIHNTKGEFSGGDITKITDEEFRKLRGSVDVIVGGFPCQAFSISGLRRGFEDVRGTMFFEIARAIKQIEPRYFILENVKGLLSHKKGETFATILATISELGYDAEWVMLNSKNFGVPQNRERVYIVGYIRGECRGEIFSIKESCQESCQRACSKIIQVGNISNNNSYGGNPQTGRVYSSEGISPCLNTMQGGSREPKILQRGHGYNKGGIKDIAPPLTASSYQQNNYLYDDCKIRKLTPRECWRLQGFPDWAFNKAKNAGISDSQLYKQAGNAVTVDVVKYIAEKIYSKRKGTS